jgi:DNA-binding MarR family transcriptional regulator
MAPVPPAPFDDDEDPAAPRAAEGLARLAVVLRQDAWQAASARGLTPTQARILGELAAPGAGAARHTDVARALAVTEATASDAVASLVAKKLVRKEADPADGRAVRLAPTAAGRREAVRVGAPSPALVAAVASLPVPDQGALLRALSGTLRALLVAGEVPAARACVTCRHFRPSVHDDPGRPHHCAFVGEAFGDRHLRLHCGDHVAAPPAEAEAAWARFADAAPE